MANIKINQPKSAGFTIVELIVVVVVIGVLVTLSVFGYGQWRRSVATREVLSDLNGVMAAMDSARNWGSGYPVYTFNTSFPSATFTASPNVTLNYFKGDATFYCVTATSKVNAAVKYYINTTSNNKTPVAGQCT